MKSDYHKLIGLPPSPMSGATLKLDTTNKFCTLSGKSVSLKSSIEVNTTIEIQIEEEC